MFGLALSVTRETGEDVVLRQFTREEATAAAPYLADPDVNRTIMIGTFASTEQSVGEWYDKVVGDPDKFIWGIYVRDEQGNEVRVGHTDLNFKQKRQLRGSTGCVIFRKDYWGEGIISAAHLARTLYAVEVLDLLAIDSDVVVGNVASLKALKRVGYAVVGTDYGKHLVQGQLNDLDRLLWVNPTEHAWNYFWRERPVPEHMVQARLQALQALTVARDCVTYYKT